MSNRERKKYYESYLRGNELDELITENTITNPTDISENKEYLDKLRYIYERHSPPIKTNIWGTKPATPTQIEKVIKQSRSI